LVNTPYGTEYFDEFGRWRLKVLGAQLADLVTARTVRRFRAVSQAVKDAYVERLRLRPELVDVIPEGRDPARLGQRTDARRDTVRTELGVHGAPMILAVGRQDPQKGFGYLLRAVPALIEARPDLKVLIAGRPGRSTIELQGLAGGLQDAVRFLGERDDVADLLCAADVFVLPSMREGIPGVVQEAMALRAPIVASDIGPVREAVGDPPLAELVPPGDSQALGRAVLRVLDDPANAARQATEAQTRFLAEFDIARIADRMVRFYEAALMGRGSP
jgi:glycosyltransferase involved in cell wall biosynthesis